MATIFRPSGQKIHRLTLVSFTKATFFCPQDGRCREFQLYTVFSRIIAGGDYLFFLTKRGRLFQILLTRSRALNILFYFPLKSINNHIK